MSVITLNDSTFNEQIADGLTLVDFWAPWCGPCRIIAPVVEELATQYEGQVKVAKLNVDDNQAAAARYGVRSIPTLILFRDGQPVENLIGVQPKRAFDQILARHMNPPA